MTVQLKYALKMPKLKELVHVEGFMFSRGNNSALSVSYPQKYLQVIVQKSNWVQNAQQLALLNSFKIQCYLFVIFSSLDLLEDLSFAS